MQATYRTVFKWLAVSVLGLISWNTVSAGTIYVPDPSLASVQTAINSASDGDTISMPAGSATWTRTLTINKAITLQGAGSSQTIITNSVPTSGTLMTITLSPGQLTRLTSFQVPNSSIVNQSNAEFNVSGNSQQDGSRFRVDNCIFGQSPYYTFSLVDVFGVADHNTFTAGPQHIPFLFSNAHWGGGTNNYGDGVWADDTYWGTDKYFFVEDSTFTCTSSIYGESLTDGCFGCRFVIRHCTLINASVTTHGTDSTGRARGARVMEVYNNNFQGLASAWIGIRSGTGVFWGNTFTNILHPPSQIKLQCYRMWYPMAPWGEADGRNVWDSNVAGGPFVSGTVTTVGTNTLTDSTKSWTPGQWVGYSVIKVGLTGYVGGEISANTSNTLTNVPGQYSQNMVWAVGDQYQIWQVNEALDQPGVGKGGLVSGLTPVVPSGWYNQVTDPIYQWNNTSPDNSTTISYGSPLSIIKSGVHYFSAAKPGYTPYTYPHPLVSGASVSAPQNLRVTGP